MNWAAVIFIAAAAGFIQFWHLCRTAPIMLEDDFKPDLPDWEQAERSLEQSSSVDYQPAVSADALLDLERPMSGRPAALDMAGRPAPELVRQPISSCSHHAAGHQQKEHIGCAVQD
jgi:hypothetical protein